MMEPTTPASRVAPARSCGALVAVLALLGGACSSSDSERSAAGGNSGFSASGGVAGTDGASGGLPGAGGGTTSGGGPSGGGSTGGFGGAGGLPVAGGSAPDGGTTGGGGIGGWTAAGAAQPSGGTTGLGGVAGSGGTAESGGTAGSGGVVAGAAPIQGGAPQTGGESSVGGLPGSGGADASGDTPPRGPVELVDATHVRLLPGSPFYDRQELHRQGLLASLDPDRLLYEYRRLANLPQPGGVTGGYAGWDTGFIRGPMTGHYLSAASRMAVATGDDSFATKVNYVVEALAQCQAALGSEGYLAAFPEAVFDWVEGSNADNGGIVVPYYTVQKILSGLLDAHHYLGHQLALEVATHLADYLRGRLAALGGDALERTLRTDGSGNPQNEFGAMSDALSELAAVTGRAEYLETAALFNRSWFMTPLAAGEDRLEGLHGNTHIAMALGIAHTANLSGDPTSLRASEYFWELLSGEHAFVIGGNSFREWLDAPRVEAGASIDGGASLPATTAETCNSHNMLKLTSLLFTRNPRVEYADYFERTLYNHILASVAPDTGQVTYFTPLHGHFRTYLDGTYCCTGTGIENTPRYGEGIYFQQGDALYVNLYVPSEVRWETTGLTLQQTGNAAVGETVALAVTAGGPTSATLLLRIPSWSDSPVVTLNGSTQEPVASPSGYFALSRQWSAGDIVTVTLPASLRLEHAKDVPTMVSVFHGPVLLAGELGSEGMPNDFADKDAPLTIAPATVPDLVTSSMNPADWLEATADTPLTFRAHDAGPASGITFRPLYDVHHQRYSVYWTLSAAN